LEYHEKIGLFLNIRTLKSLSSRFKMNDKEKMNEND